jgi:hypothetical protein
MKGGNVVIVYALGALAVADHAAVSGGLRSLSAE